MWLRLVIRDIFGGKICLIGYLLIDIVFIMLCYLFVNKGFFRVVCYCYIEIIFSFFVLYWRSGGMIK